jgi:hypothetical protein
MRHGRNLQGNLNDISVRSFVLNGAPSHQGLSSTMTDERTSWDNAKGNDTHNLTPEVIVERASLGHASIGPANWQ